MQISNPDDDDIFLAVEAFLTAIPEINTVITTDDCPLEDADLPAVLVMMGEGEQNRSNSSWWDALENVEIGAMFTRLCGDTVEEQRTQMLAALALRQIIPDAFARSKQRLYLSGQQLVLKDVSTMTKSRLETRPWGDEVYYATTYRFVVTTERS